MKYQGFISYRRKDAAFVARWLRQRLLGFRPPRELLDQFPPDQQVIAERRVAYFLDTSYQSANEDFWRANILPALEESDHLIVLSSPSALEHRNDGSENWVGREIDSFLQIHGKEQARRRIILALTPNASTERFPGCLNELGSQWDWADLRNVTRWGWLQPGMSERAEDAFLKIIARIYDVPQHLLPILRREEARRRGRVRLAFGIAATAIVVALSTALGWAVVERGRAVEERARAIEQRDAALVAQSRYVAQAAKRLVRTGDFGVALGLALDVLPADIAHPDRPLEPSAEGALLEAVTRSPERAILSGHEDWVPGATFSPDGKQVITASLDATARLWDSQTGRQLAVLKGHADRVLDGAFSPDGTRVATASSDRTVRIWESASGKEIAVLNGHKRGVVSVAYSADGAQLMTRSDDNTVRLWDARNNSELTVFHPKQGKLFAARYFKSGRPLAVSISSDRVVHFWDIRTGEEMSNLQLGPFVIASAVGLSPEGTRVLIGSLDGTVSVFNIWSKQELAVLRGHQRLVRAASFSPNGARIVTASDDYTVRVWSADGKELGVLRGHQKGVLSARFSHDGALIVSGSVDHTARIWHAEAGHGAPMALAHDGKVQDIRFSRDGAWLITASLDKTARIWSTQSGRVLVLQGHTAPLNSADFSADGTEAITTSDDGTARIWDAHNGRELMVLKGHRDRVISGKFSSDGKRVVTAGYDGIARLWDRQSGRELKTFKRAFLESADLSPDGTRLVAAAGNEAVVWDVGTGELLMTLRGHAEGVVSAAYSRDGKYIATSSHDRTARIWDASNGRELSVLRGHGGVVSGVKFSVDDRHVVTSSWDRTARLWDTVTGRELVVFGDSGNLIASADIAPGGGMLATGGEHGQVELWPLPLGQTLIDRACQMMLRPLTHAEREQYFLEKEPRIARCGLKPSDN